MTFNHSIDNKNTNVLYMATLPVLILLMLMTVTVVTNIRTITPMTNTDSEWRHTYPYFHIYMLCGNEREGGESKLSSSFYK